MKNQQNFTIGLLVITAVILAVTLFVQTSDNAYATAPDRGGNYIVINGSVSKSADLVYVINGATKTLLAYFADHNNGRINIIAKIDLAKEFKNE